MLINRGARHVFAVDVGSRQFDFALSRNSRVTVWEKTNVKALTLELFPLQLDMCTADLSFRSLSGVMRHLLLLTRCQEGFFLLKPQFELPEKFLEKGVVKDLSAVRQLCYERLESWARDEGAYARAMLPSAVPGRFGNREVFFHMTLHKEQALPMEQAQRCALELSFPEKALK